MLVKRSSDTSDKAAVRAQIPQMHAENVRRLQAWIALPSIAAENRNYPEGAQRMAELARQAGFKDVRILPTSGKPGVFGTLDAQAPTTLAIYMRYDVTQFVPQEWSSPPLEGRLVQKGGLGTVCIGRGALDQQGPQNSLLSALMAFRSAGKKLPVNLVLLCEGEEEIGSPHFDELVMNPDVLAHLKPCVGLLLPDACQSSDGSVNVNLGAKGIVELELISSGARWGRGPKVDVHSSRAAHMDSPTWHLVQALNTLVEKDGHTPAVEGFFEQVTPMSAAQERMVTVYAATVSEDAAKKQFGVERWIDDLNWRDSLLRLYSQPTINITGLASGFTGEGGNTTVLSHQAVAKIDIRLVPDMTVSDSLEKLRVHLAKRGFGDIEVILRGGYDPTQTDPDSRFTKAMLETYRALGSAPSVLPRNPGSWPGYRFTNPPLNLPAGTFGLGYGNCPHAADEYYLIDSIDPSLQGLDGAIASFVEYLYALA
jgi:acetylornithine deacetylase/succinyl-diaminopimelate desuccinylase-like protein